jgi:hypothetical protein
MSSRFPNVAGEATDRNEVRRNSAIRLMVGGGSGYGKPRVVLDMRKIRGKTSVSGGFVWRSLPLFELQ